MKLILLSLGGPGIRVIYITIFNPIPIPGAARPGPAPGALARIRLTVDCSELATVQVQIQKRISSLPAVATATASTLVIELWLSIPEIVLLQVHCNPQYLWCRLVSRKPNPHRFHPLKTKRETRNAKRGMRNAKRGMQNAKRCPSRPPYRHAYGAYRGPDTFPVGGVAGSESGPRD